MFAVDQRSSLLALFVSEKEQKGFYNLDTRKTASFWSSETGSKSGNVPILEIRDKWYKTFLSSLLDGKLECLSLEIF